MGCCLRQVYVADIGAAAANEFFPGSPKSFLEIGKERGWRPVTRAKFDALRRPTAIQTLPAVLIFDNDDLAAPFRKVAECHNGKASFVAHPVAELLNVSQNQARAKKRQNCGRSSRSKLKKRTAKSESRQVR